MQYCSHVFKCALNKKNCNFSQKYIFTQNQIYRKSSYFNCVGQDRFWHLSSMSANIWRITGGGGFKSAIAMEHRQFGHLGFDVPVEKVLKIYLGKFCTANFVVKIFRTWLFTPVLYHKLFTHLEKCFSFLIHCWPIRARECDTRKITKKYKSLISSILQQIF